MKLLNALNHQKASGGNKNRTNPENYRPNSLTSVTCKLMEHIIHSHIMKHLDRDQTLSNAQHGFRKFHSCETQLLQTVNTISTSLNIREQIDSILLEYSLFLIFINDMPSLVKSTIALFADDAYLLKSISSQHDVDILQGDLNILQTWEGKCSMESHPEKCQLLRLTNKRKTVATIQFMEKDWSWLKKLNT